MDEALVGTISNLHEPVRLARVMDFGRKSGERK
jgi:hypothetical protein